MVTFELIESTEAFAVYWYYPEDDRSAGHGVLILDKRQNQTILSELAPKDAYRQVSMEESDRLRSAVNEMRRLRGAPELTEAEWPSEVSKETISLYADHAAKRILEAYRGGQLPEHGTAVWY